MTGSSTTGLSFADIIAPVTPEAFFDEYYDKKPLLIPGTPDKFPEMLTWGELSSLLDITSIWTSDSLDLVLDCNLLKAQEYCFPTVDSGGAPIHRPDPDRVTELLNRGASLVCNDIARLQPGLAAIETALEAAFYSRVQANLYCSWQAHQAFNSHFDTHDVFAIHIDGEKRWQIYEGRSDYPIADKRFKTIPQEEHDAAKGAVAQDLMMRPGDVLYLPRGLYHDALAVTGSSLHITYGVTRVIGYNIVQILKDWGIADPLFRRNVPRPQEGRQALADHLAGLADQLEKTMKSKAFVDQIDGFHRSLYQPDEAYALPVDLDSPIYRVRGQGFSVSKEGPQWVLAGPRGKVPVPEGLEQPLGWIVARGSFTTDALGRDNPGLTPAARDKLLQELTSMRVIERV